MIANNPLEAGPLSANPADLDLLSRVAQRDGAPETVSGTNPLVAAANPLLNLIPQLRAIVQHADPAQIREFLVQQVQAFETRAQSMGISAENVIGARYCLCTALDEKRLKAGDLVLMSVDCSTPFCMSFPPAVPGSTSPVSMARNRQCIGFTCISVIMGSTTRSLQRYASTATISPIWTSRAVRLIPRRFPRKRGTDWL